MKNGTKSFFWIAGGMMSGIMMLSSCANDDLFSDNGREAFLTVELQKPSFSDITRTELSEAGGNLDCVWKNGDKLIVANKGGGRVGVLPVMEGYDGMAEARFAGSITGVANGVQSLNFFYLGTGFNADSASGEQLFDLSSQEGTLKSLSEKDLLTATANVIIDGETASADNIDLQRAFSFGRFRLVMPEGVSAAGETVTITGANLNSSATLSYTNSLIPTPGSINVTVQEGNEFYMTIIPAEGIEPTFTIFINGKTYEGSLAPRTWVAGEYVRAELGNGEYAGIPVDMREKEAGKYPGYENEDPRNPLHIFAKGNLYRVEGTMNGISQDELENGALYQWGRNYGYMDSQGMYSNTSSPFYYPLQDFTNYLDAQGMFDNNSAGDNMFYGGDYYVYNGSNLNLTSGTGISLNNAGTFVHWTRAYTSVADIKAHPDKFFMDATVKQITNTSDGRWLRVCTTGDDYWVFDGGGNNWYERASACGYENSNPCPEGWRLPTKEEFAAIAPPTVKTASAGTNNGQHAQRNKSI